MDRLPPSLKSLFEPSNEGSFSAKLKSSLQTAEIEHQLRTAGLSYRTKITKSRAKGLVYVVQLVS